MGDAAREEPGGQPGGISGGLRLNKLGHLEMAGVDLAALARRLGTPLYVLDEGVVRAQCRRYVGALSVNYPRWDVAYASKALSNKAVIGIVRQEGLSLDVVSGGELYTAISAGFPPGRVYFHGNNKSDDEIMFGLECNVGRFVVDSVTEFEVIQRMAKSRGTAVDILVRTRPGIEAHCHEYVRTGASDSKFGVSFEEALYISRLASRCENTRLRGLHCHIGSQVLETEPFGAAAVTMVQALVAVRREVWKTRGRVPDRDLPDELDLGGGLGVADATGARPPSIEEYVRTVCEAVKCEWRRLNRDAPETVERGGQRLPALPKIILEPGRSIVNAAGVTLYTVGGAKVSGNRRRYVFVDGGMADNPRPALYGAKYSAVLANRASEKPELEYRIVGKCCESGDVLVERALLPRVRRGDILAVMGTGAYNYSMSSNYNRLPRPAMVLVYDGAWDVVVRRETYEHLSALDVLPPRLYAGEARQEAGRAAANE
ncbi:MAG: diaminopimelate decarboxylase [Firmicutes bacterium]|nr:diaminopimelate decarboxylase [Bacillota bacterium]